MSGGQLISGQNTAVKQDLGFEYERNIKILDNYLEKMLANIFQNMNYKADDHISQDIVKSANPFPFKWDKLYGEDYIKAMYCGLPVEMSEITLVYHPMEDNSLKINRNKELLAFKGIWFTCDFNREFKAELTLQERRMKSKFAKSLLVEHTDVETGNMEFDSKFLVLTDDKDAANDMLTPYIMEQIVGANHFENGNVYMRFLSEGKVHIAISMPDLFDPNNIKEGVISENMGQRIVSRIWSITNIIDELKHSESVFK